jgi:hypothetical protein
MLGQDGTEPGRMAAVVLADLAVEMAAWAAARDEPLPGKNRWGLNPSLPVVLDALNRAWQKREQSREDVPEIREANRLHGIRNTVQHSGFGPSTSQVLESRVGSQRFLAWVAADWFGQDLESISRGRLITDPAVRTSVELAERAAGGDDYSTAAKHLAVAFEAARWRFRAAQMHRGSYVPAVTASDVSAAVSEVKKGDDDKTAGLGYRKLERVLRGLAHHLDGISDRVEALSLGARASDYVWFKNNFPEVHRVMKAGEANLVPYEPNEPIERGVYLRGLDFVTTTALHWQEFPTAKPDSDDD